MTAMSGTAAHIVRLWVSVPPSQPPSRNSFAKNSSRMAARLAAKGSSPGSTGMVCFGIARVVASITLDEFDAAISCDPVDRCGDRDAAHEKRRLLGHRLGGAIVRRGGIARQSGRRGRGALVFVVCGPAGRSDAYLRPRED